MLKKYFKILSFILIISLSFLLLGHIYTHAFQAEEHQDKSPCQICHIIKALDYSPNSLIKVNVTLEDNNSQLNKVFISNKTINYFISRAPPISL